MAGKWPSPQQLVVGCRICLGHVRPTLKNISNINFCAGKSHGLNNSRQQLSGSSYEWLSSQVFVGARRLSDKHHFGVRIADAKNDLVTERHQLRTFAAGEIPLLQLTEF